MALAYHLLAHRNPGQLRRLIDALWAPENLYVVHYDRRRPAAEHRAVRALARERSNILIQPPRAVLWGRFSLLQAQLDGLRLAVAHGGAWTHWINLSGQCFPLHSPDTIAGRLAAKPGVSFISSFDPLATDTWPCAHRRLRLRAVDQPWLDFWLWVPGLGLRLRRLFGGGPIPVMPRRRPKPAPPFARWYGGANWVILARSAAELVVSPAATPTVDWLADTIQPEESFFQTLLLNSPEAPRIRNEDLREIFWFNNEISPHIFRLQHFDRLQESARAGRLFARKFDPGTDPHILAAIEERLLSLPSSDR